MTKEQYDRVAQEDKDHSEEMHRQFDERVARARKENAARGALKQPATVEFPASFTRACKTAGIEATRRQYRKFLKKQGQAYRNR